MYYTLAYRNDLHGRSRRWVYIDLPNLVLWRLRVLEELRESRRSASVAIVEAKVEERKKVDVPASENFLKLGQCIGFSTFTTFELHSLAAEGPIFLSEIESSGRFWCVRDEEVTTQRYRERNNAIDNEEPLPAVEATFPIQVVHGCHQIAAEHGSNRAG